MIRYKYSFRNRSLAEHINICEQTVAGLSKLSAEDLAQCRLPELQAMVAAARASHERIAVLRAELKAEVSRRKQLVLDARDETIRTANMAAVNMKNDPVKMMALGLNLIKPGAPVGVPDAPQNLRGSPTRQRGRGAAPLGTDGARMHFPDRIPAGWHDGLASGGFLHAADLHRHGFGERREILVPRPRLQRPRRKRLEQ